MGASRRINEPMPVVNIVVDIAVMLHVDVPFPLISEDNCTRMDVVDNEQTESICISFVVRAFHEETVTSMPLDTACEYVSYYYFILYIIIMYRGMAICI